jgi:hypothetical protein
MEAEGHSSLISDQAHPRKCPCCGDILPLGLFAHHARVLLPKAIFEMNRVGYPLEHCYEETILSAAGRWFVAVDATLPLDWDESPVRVLVWLEVDQRYADRVGSVLAGERSGIDGSGVLACDIPGFAGTMGARGLFRIESGWSRPRLLSVHDARIRRLHGYGGHEGLVELYRRCWSEGASIYVAPAHLALRATVGNAWRALIDRPTFRSPIEPPPRLAGIHPAELIIAPPIDTGGLLCAATLGNAEANPKQAVELSVFAYDPSDAFLRCFAEFCYWSRGTSTPLRYGTIVADQHIPDGEMEGWLLCWPWWISDEWKRAEVYYADVRVQLLTAIPVYSDEIAYARRRGIRALRHHLEESGLDVADLKRASAIS